MSQSGFVDNLLDRLETPPGFWSYGARIWVAMMLALYVAFWLQLEGASTAMVCVAVLAQQKRGQAVSKGAYRLLGTFVGFVVSLALAALFGQDRILMLSGFGVWLGLCVFAANYLPDARGYGAMLSGYTVAIIAIANIDRPGNVFAAGLDRVTAIVVGILAVTFINDALGAPEVLPTVRSNIAGARDAMRAYARRASLTDIPAESPDRRAAVLRRVMAARTDIDSLSSEFSDGPSRAAGARGAVAALFGLGWAADAFRRALSRGGLAARDGGPDEALLVRRVRDGLTGDVAALSELEEGARAAAADPESTPGRVLLRRRAADVLAQDKLVGDGQQALEGDRLPNRDVSLPIHRDLPDALRSTLRVMVAYAISAVLFVSSGWPAASTGLVEVAALVAFSAIVPDARTFASSVLVATPLTIALAGFVRFFVLDGVQGFPLLAIAMAPPIFIGCYLSLKPRTFTHGFILLVFFPVALAPSNPQDYDLQAFLDTGVLYVTAAVLLFLSIRFILPTGERQRLGWLIRSARTDVLSALQGQVRDGVAHLARSVDRLVQSSANASAASRPATLRHAFALYELDTTVTGAQAALNRLSAWHEFEPIAIEGRIALARIDVAGLREVATSLIAASSARHQASAATEIADPRGPASHAIANLAATADLVQRNRPLRRPRAFSLSKFASIKPAWMAGSRAGGAIR